jgi:D-glycerate 3-kinase
LIVAEPLLSEIDAVFGVIVCCMSISSALLSLGQAKQFAKLSAAHQQYLTQALLGDPERAAALGITPGQILAQTQAWVQVFPSLEANWPQGLPPLVDYLQPLWQLWLPASLQMITEQQRLDRPLIQGIVGAQGAGKTTLCQLLQCLLTGLGYPTLSLSIDDFYKTFAERQALRQQDPRLSWRGPPGTHDLDLALQVLRQLRESSDQPVAIPRFDKTAHQGAGDRSELTELAQGNKIILFEGWLIGARPIPPERFASAPPPIDSEADRQFAREMNMGLQVYQPLWGQLDRLMVLDLADYQSSYQWRTQAEQAALGRGEGGMDKEAVTAFVTYFWRALHPQLFIKPLTQFSSSPTNSAQPPVHLVVEIQPDHQPGRAYRPD